MKKNVYTFLLMGLFSFSSLAMANLCHENHIDQNVHSSMYIQNCKNVSDSCYAMARKDYELSVSDASFTCQFLNNDLGLLENSCAQEHKLKDVDSNLYIQNCKNVSDSCYAMARKDYELSVSDASLVCQFLNNGLELLESSCVKSLKSDNVHSSIYIQKCSLLTVDDQ